MPSVEAMSRGGRNALAILACFVLAGCLSDQKLTLSRCLRDARDHFPHDTGTSGGPIAKFTQSCMASEGYICTINEPYRPVEECIERMAPDNGYCYRPTSLFTLLGYWIEIGSDQL
jgi:hypothetical protein